MSRFLTKNLFKLGLECPTKLYYCNNGEYNDNRVKDSFMQALAKGGYKIDEFAKYKYSNDPIKDRISIENLNEEDALLLPNERLFSSEN